MGGNGIPMKSKTAIISPPMVNKPHWQTTHGTGREKKSNKKEGGETTGLLS